MNNTRPRVTVASTRGVVAAAHPLAAQAGARILREGGNAFDAAVAAAAALNVVEPFMSGLAGMGYAVCYSAATGRVLALDFVPPVPRGFAVESVRSRPDLGRGARSCGIPGNLAGWASLVERLGRKSLATVLGPAIELAREGFPLTAFSANEIAVTAPLIRSKGAEISGGWEQTYCPGGSLPKTGSILRQPALARTFETIAGDGIGVLYGGSIGQQLVRLAALHGGTLDVADLEAYSPSWLTPLAATYRGFTIHVPPPPSEAFQFLLTMRLLEGLELGAMEHNGPEHMDAVLRAIRLAAITRIANNLPEPDRLTQLLSDRAVLPMRDRMAGGEPLEGPTEQSVQAAPGAPNQHTTSLSIADGEGNAICLTQSLGSVFGCGLVLPEHGICLNNFLMWGDVHSEGTKRLAPGGPLALPLAPSLTTANIELSSNLRASGGAAPPERPVLALGTPGSYGIAQHQAQVLVRHVDFGFRIQEAIEEPRGRLTDGRAVLLEDRFPQATVDELGRRGHLVETGPAWTRKVGGVQAVAIDQQHGAFFGGADPRRDGYVATP